MLIARQDRFDPSVHQTWRRGKPGGPARRGSVALAAGVPPLRIPCYSEPEQTRVKRVGMAYCEGCDGPSCGMIRVDRWIAQHSERPSAVALPTRSKINPGHYRDGRWRMGLGRQGGGIECTPSLQRLGMFCLTMDGRTSNKRACIALGNRRGRQEIGTPTRSQQCYPLRGGYESH